MKQGLLLWNPCRPFCSPFSIRTRRAAQNQKTVISTTMESVKGTDLTARERRQLRNERRENRATNWREEVEERLLKKPKKRYASWTEELNLDNLALLGPQWWVVRVSRVSGQDSAERMARSLARNFPNIEFQVYSPAVQVRRKLKNGTISVKPKSLFPGCVFLKCVLNKELHDFIRECHGVGGFVGSKVGNIKRQINRPKPIATEDIEAIFSQVKEEQKKVDQALKEERQTELVIKNGELDIGSYLHSGDVTDSVTDLKPQRRTRKGPKSVSSDPLKGEDEKLPTPGSSIRVMSGPFAEFVGNLKKLDRRTGRATVGFMLFGKESLVDVDVNEISAETA